MARAIGLALALAFVARVAHADNLPAKCSVRIIQASHGDPAGIDPQINRLRPYLEKAPFTAWKSFKLIDKKELTLSDGGNAGFDLPNGAQGSLTYTEHVLRPDGKHRLRLKLSIVHNGKPCMNTTFVLDEGGMVLQVGEKHEGGVLVLGVSCETH